MSNTKNISIIKKHLITYPTPITINYAWSFGSLAGIFLGIQLLTGILLAIHYIAETDISFDNIERIMRDVHYGWLIRYTHANSASFFFISVYAHILRGIYYKSFVYPRNIVWYSGIVILLLSIITAFLGYVLPWGQMSYRAATVITNLVTAIPYAGKYIVYWIWGDYTVSGFTLTRFYNFHYLFAVILTLIIIIHISLVHESGSSSPTLLNNDDFVSFYRHLYLKDLFILILTLIFFFIILFYHPNLLGHTDNYIKANSMVTPTHIVPEWYFLPFYAILRSIDDKLLGVVVMLFSILVLAFLPNLKIYIKSEFYSVIFSNWFFWSFLLVVVMLGIIGGLPAEYPYIYFGKLFTFMYFLLFFVLYIETLIIKSMIEKWEWVLRYKEFKGVDIFHPKLVQYYKKRKKQLRREWFKTTFGPANWLYGKTRTSVCPFLAMFKKSAVYILSSVWSATLFVLIDLYGIQKYFNETELSHKIIK
jgi:quinol-cytochrome oxidoreductase complex cytochrome b subunit